jgi:hypothetical protein
MYSDERYEEKTKFADKIRDLPVDDEFVVKW